MKINEEGYYIVNAKKVLYWDGQKWMKPVQNNRGRLGTHIGPIEKQPNVKTADFIDWDEDVELVITRLKAKP